jgi:hypothetical protein
MPAPGENRTHCYYVWASLSPSLPGADYVQHLEFGGDAGRRIRTQRQRGAPVEQQTVNQKGQQLDIVMRIRSGILVFVAINEQLACDLLRTFSFQAELEDAVSTPAAVKE